MAIKQSIWTLDGKRLDITTLDNEKILEDLLNQNIAMLNEDWLLIGRQVSVAGGYIDLLCIDRGGSLIVIELKKDLTPREVAAQAIDYASCVSEWHIEDIAQVYLKFSNNIGSLNEAFKSKFNTVLDEENINNEVSIIIVASKMDNSTERIITYLNGKYGVPINILFFSVFSHGNEKLLSRVALIDETEPVPSKHSVVDWNGEYYVSFGEGSERRWSDAQKYGFISAGGGAWYSKTLSILDVGDRIWVNIPQKGYVGVGKVIETAKKANEVVFTVDGIVKKFFELNLEGDYYKEEVGENAEYIVKVEWIKTVKVANAKKELGFFGNQNSACKPVNDKWLFTIKRLNDAWGI